MKVILIVFLLAASGCGCLSAQVTDSTPGLVLDGGRLLIDLIQTFKSKQPPFAVQGKTMDGKTLNPDCPAGIVQICFQNTHVQSIQVGVFARPDTDSMRSDLLIPAGQQACSYFYDAGIYVFEVQALIRPDSSQFLERGELLLGKCEQSIQIIQFP